MIEINFSVLAMGDNSVLHFLHSDNRDHTQLPDPGNGGVPAFKATCCMSYAFDKQCRRCPFRQIGDGAEMERALQECRDRRRGTYLRGELQIAYHSKYW